MSKTKKQIYQEFVDRVTNPQRFDMIHDYMTDECVFHGAPYVGLGIMLDDSSGDKVFIYNIAPKSPAAEFLQVGDEIVQVSDETGVREGYDHLKGYGWGQGKAGTQTTVTVRREGLLYDFTLTRGRIEGFDTTLGAMLEMWATYMLKTWPDMHQQVDLMVEEGDFLAYFITNTGTNADYAQSAMWTECGILRFQDDKIVEWWSVEDGLSQIRQLGYLVREPETAQ